MKQLIILPLCWLLGVLLGTFLAPLAIEVILWLLREPTYRCPYTAQGAADYSPTEAK